MTSFQTIISFLHFTLLFHIWHFVNTFVFHKEIFSKVYPNLMTFYHPIMPNKIISGKNTFEIKKKRMLLNMSYFGALA